MNSDKAFSNNHRAVFHRAETSHNEMYTALKTIIVNTTLLSLQALRRCLNVHKQILQHDTEERYTNTVHHVCVLCFANYPEESFVSISINTAVVLGLLLSLMKRNNSVVFVGVLWVWKVGYLFIYLFN